MNDASNTGNDSKTPGRSISAEEFDAMFDSGEDIAAYVDWDKGAMVAPGELSPGQRLSMQMLAAEDSKSGGFPATDQAQSLSVSLPPWAFDRLQSEAARQGVSQEELASAFDRPAARQRESFVLSLTLGVNIDHVATLRQARYARTPEAHNVEPDLVAAAAICERAGAQSITVHLRADRRHLQDLDLARLRASVRTKLNMEMGNTPEILAIALQIRPEDICLVPENRQEITTEGGLDAHGQRAELTPTVAQLNDAKLRVSLFIDPLEEQIRAAVTLGAPVVELHTGAFANATGGAQTRELERLRVAAELAASLGLQVNAGHGLSYANLPVFLDAVPHLSELNIGHSVVSRAVFVGLERAVGEMLKLMETYRG